MSNYQTRTPSHNPNGRVYVIGCEVGCKIGFTTKDPHERLKGLQTGNPFQLVLVKPDA